MNLLFNRYYIVIDSKRKLPGGISFSYFLLCLICIIYQNMQIYIFYVYINTLYMCVFIIIDI